MELTIDQALQQGAAAHNKGNLQEAERVYRAILKIQPRHPGANHNLGLIAVSLYKSEAALLLLETALEVDPTIEQFWISYIDALINTNQIKNAEQAIEKAKKAGFFGEGFDALSVRLLSPIQRHTKGGFFQAQDGNYLGFLKVLHRKRYQIYFEIGSRTGDSLCLSHSPSIAIDPYYQLKKDPIGKKDFCLLFQETSDHFFEKTLPKFPHFKCELGFIDGMHLFECALRDFINLAKISSKNSLFLFHDALPWSYEMATRDYETIPKGAAWTGDIWKLIPILIDIGMHNNINILTSGPSGLLAVWSPEKEIIAKLEQNFDAICAEWTNIELISYGLANLYKKKIFIKPEKYLQLLESKSFGKEVGSISKEWVSH
jgi:tetratricopeptide (TPR) repeat protein